MKRSFSGNLTSLLHSLGIRVVERVVGTQVRGCVQVFIFSRFCAMVLVRFYSNLKTNGGDEK